MMNILFIKNICLRKSKLFALKISKLLKTHIRKNSQIAFYNAVTISLDDNTSYLALSFFNSSIIFHSPCPLDFLCYFLYILSKSGCISKSLKIYDICLNNNVQILLFQQKNLFHIWDWNVNHQQQSSTLDKYNP